MRTIRPLSEDDVLRVFLEGEMRSERFSKDLLAAMESTGISLEEIRTPEANEARRRLMGAYRGWGENRELFERWPETIHWIEAALNRDEARRARYILYDYWDELSGGTSLPEDAAKSIRAGKTVFGQSNERFLRAAEYARGGGEFPPVILLSDGHMQTVIVEGHLRMTAFALCGFPFVEMRAIVGLCKGEEIRKWNGEI